MTMIRYSAGITDINGPVAGMIYRTDQCGPHVQCWPRTIRREPTPWQKSWRAAFGRLWHHYWKKILTIAQRKLWWYWSADHPVTNKKGEELFITAFNWFVKINIRRVMEGKEPYLEPPT